MKDKKETKMWREKVKDILKKKGLKQKDLAELSGITESSLSRYMKDLREPKVDDFIKMADALGVSVDYLLEKPMEHVEGDNYTNVCIAILKYGVNLSLEDKMNAVKLLLK